MKFIARHSTSQVVEGATRVDQGINLRTSISISTHTHTHTLTKSPNIQVRLRPQIVSMCVCECLLFWSKFIFNILVARLHAKPPASASAAAAVNVAAFVAVGVRARFENTIN